MAVFALNDVDLYANGLDLSCYANSVNVNAVTTELDATTFCSAGWTVPIGGLKSMTLTASGPADMAAAANQAALNAEDEVLAVTIGDTYTLSAVPAGGTEGNAGYFTQGVLLDRVPLQGAVGELAEWSAMWKGHTKLVRGTLTSVQTVTATGNGTGFQLGAVGATQSVYCAAHFLTAGGTTPSITVVVQSDDNAGFSSPTSRITFSAQTTKGAQFSSAAGAITDDYWRATWTVSGTSPSFQVRTIIGII